MRPRRISGNSATQVADRGLGDLTKGGRTMSRFVLAQKLTLGPLACFLLLSATGCPSTGGITIKSNDMTVPSLRLNIAQSGQQDVAVNGGGFGQRVKLERKTGNLNLLATATDSESGIQTLEIWMAKTITSCIQGVCSTEGPLLGRPVLESVSPPKSPGETTSETRLLTGAVDLSKEIQQGTIPTGDSLTVEFKIHAKAVNHQGRQTQTPEITLLWTEP